MESTREIPLIEIFYFLIPIHRMIPQIFDELVINPIGMTNSPPGPRSDEIRRKSIFGEFSTNTLYLNPTYAYLSE